jgi:proton glutamate symport protein
VGIKKIPLSTQIIVAIALGVAWAFFLKPFPELVEFTMAWIKPLGKIFIKLLYLVAIPLVFTSLLTGMGSIKSMGELKSIGKNTLVIFFITGSIATVIGLSIAYLIKPGHKIEHLSVSASDADKIASFQKGSGEAAQTASDFFANLVPDNFIHTLSSNTMMLQVVFVAFIMGLALSKIEIEPKEKILWAIDAIQQWFTQLIHLIMLFAPIGVFALTASLDLNVVVLLSLAKYMLTVLLGLAIMLFVVYPLFFSTIGRTSYRSFFTNSRSVLLMAFSTSSSNATLPLTLETVKTKFGIPDNISNFVVSLGATVNMDGTALYQSVAVYFISQSLGVELSLAQMAIIVLTAIVSAVGAAGVPGAGMLTLLIILQSVGLPAEGIVLILAPDRILDMFRTVVNVAGDISTSLCVNGLSAKKDPA